MFFRRKQSGRHNYLQIVENRWIEGKTRQRVIATVGRLDRLTESGQLEVLLRSGNKFLPKPEDTSSTGDDEAQENVQKKKVFVVDDDNQVIRTIKRSLAKYADEVDVEGCKDGIEALVQIGRELPDVVLLDVYMEGIDGFEVCRRLKKMPNLEDVKIVAMTAFPSEEAKARILDYGAAEYLVKPIAAEQLLPLIK